MLCQRRTNNFKSSLRAISELRLGDAGREGREASWGERSERAGGGVAPKRRCSVFVVGVSGT